MPVYLFRRARLLGDKPAYAILWCVLFLALLGGVLLGIINNDAFQRAVVVQGDKRGAVLLASTLGDEKRGAVVGRLGHSSVAQAVMGGNRFPDSFERDSAWHIEMAGEKIISAVGDNGARSFSINGVPVFIRGGGWASDLMLRPKDDARLAAEFAYTKDLGLNTIRLEGKLEPTFPGSKDFTLRPNPLFDIRRYGTPERFRGPLAAERVTLRTVSEDEGRLSETLGRLGRYLGLVTLDTGEGTTEFLQLVYANDAKLYVPVSNLHLIGRYSGASPEAAPLHELGSNQWDKAKKRAARQAHDTAAELLNLYAQRAARTGHAFGFRPHDYEAFAEGFGFDETPDQQEAIERATAQRDA